MHEARRNLLVGLFVLVGLVALGTLVVWFGRDPTWLMQSRRAYTLRAHFEAATGIKPGTPVTVGGVQVGRVVDLAFVDPQRFDLGVHVTLALDPPYQFRQGTRATTSEPGFGMGRPPIVLIPPADPVTPFLPSGEVIRGEMVSAMDAIFPQSVRANFEKTATQIGEAAAALTPVLEDMHELMRARDVAAVDRPGGPPGNLSSAMARADAMLKHFNDVLGDPAVRSNLKESINNIYTVTEDAKSVSADLKQFAEDARQVASDARGLIQQAQGTLTNLDDNVQRLSREGSTMLERASGFLTQLTLIGSRANAGEGTLGKLVTDDRLFEAMVLTFRRLAETTEEFRLLATEWQKGRIRVAF